MSQTFAVNFTIFKFYCRGLRIRFFFCAYYGKEIAVVFADGNIRTFCGSQQRRLKSREITWPTFSEGCKKGLNKNTHDEANLRVVATIA